MARLRSKTISVVYADRKLFDPTSRDNTLAEPAMEFTRSFTTDANPIINAEVPVIRSYGNASATFPLSVCYDFPDEPDAYEFLLAMMAWCRDNQTGTLEVSVGDFAMASLAGLTDMSARLSYSPGSVRVTVNYSFVYV